MATWQTGFLFIFCILQALLFYSSLNQCKRGCSFTLTHWLAPLGMFVWGDALVLSVFWFASSLLSLVISDWIFFLLIYSSFWLVRSIGETIYWFLQQFATIKRDLPQTLLGYNMVKNEAIWFIYQVFWQCLTVISLIATVFLFNQWL